MLRNTFLHVQGVGPATEARLWSEGVLSWDDLDKLPDTSVGRGVAERIRRTIGESEERLAARDAAWFSERLRSGSYAWRMFEDFREDTAFIDIETTGLNIGQDVITSIAVWDRQGARAFVRGRNLHEFADALSEHAVWVHFNGLRFDVPFIATELGLDLSSVGQLDVRFVLASLGIRGGLKRIERELGFDRAGFEDIDGSLAIDFWYEYERQGSRAALETLVAYNIQDVLSLDALMVRAVNLWLERLEHPTLRPMQPRVPPANPFAPDRMLVDRLLATHHAQA